MKNPFNRVAFTAATLLATAWLCRAGEVSYLETFDAYPYPWVATNVHATYPDWPNGDLRTALSNGVLRTWADFPAYNPTNTFASLKSLVLTRGGTIEAGRDLELRADLLRMSGEGAYAALGWQMDGLFDIGYFLLKGAEEVALVKHRFDQGILAPFFWEHLAVTDRPVTLVLRFRALETGLAIQTLLLDPANAGQVIFDRTVMDTPASDPVSVAPPPLQGSTDPGLAWEGSGHLSLSLFGANTNLTRLEMDVDNFGTRQTRDVTENDFLALVYTNTQRQTLAYRLFVPSNHQPGSRYPLVLCLHSSGAIGDDNVSQLEEHPPVFASPSNQAKYPCFVVAPQVSSRDARQYPDWTWWNLRERVMGVLTNLMAQYPIDPNRLYVTGISLGGIGTWDLTSDNAEYPDMFAAAVPMAGLEGPSTNVMRVTHLPIWTFHGAKDQTIPVDAVYPDPAGSGLVAKASRPLIDELRHYGGFPIYTEYAWAGHSIVPYEKTPGLVDWLMAQRRGTPVQHSPWIAVAAPASNGVWTTSYTNLDLAGTACADAGITNIVWRNESMTRYPSGPATGTTNWLATGIPLHPGRISGTRVFAFTNLVTVTATGTSWCELYGGTTTFNTVLRVVHVPIRLQARLEGGQTRLEWTGAAPSFVVQRCTDLGSANWVDVLTTGETNMVLPDAISPAFYRIRVP